MQSSNTMSFNNVYNTFELFGYVLNLIVNSNKLPVTTSQRAVLQKKICDMCVNDHGYLVSNGEDFCIIEEFSPFFIILSDGNEKTYSDVREMAKKNVLEVEGYRVPPLFTPLHI